MAWQCKHCHTVNRSSGMFCRKCSVHIAAAALDKHEVPRAAHRVCESCDKPLAHCLSGPFVQCDDCREKDREYTHRMAGWDR